MRRYLRTLFLTLVASLFAVSCVNEMELSEPITDPDVVATLVPHVNNFANQYVTKAGYSDAEKKVSSLSLYIFNNDGVLVHHIKTLDPAATSITLKKSMMNTPTHRGKLNNATVLMMANMSLSDLKKTDGTDLSAEGLTLSVLQSAYLHIPAAKTVITSLGEGFTGFPMMGQITMDLTATTAQQAAVALPLQILYAKVNFSISVVSGGENEDITPDDGKSIGFNLSGYSVHNVATVTPLATPAENGATPSTVYAYTTSGAAGNASGNVTLDGSALPFTFYVAETRYNPTSDLSGIYPDNGWIGNAAYDYLKQQYKPQVAAKATGVPATGLASYVTLNGIYTDYRGSQWVVNYKIYLGKDNMTNFQVDRNSEYTNYITIKGIRNAGGSGTGNVWIDHRVDASINGDDDVSDHVKITRETLLDSHFEVRPLRVQWEEDANGNAEYSGVRLYLPTDSEGNLLNWIGVERFTGQNCQASDTYCYQGENSTGKRRYFTQNLISELQAIGGEYGVQTDSNGKKYITLLKGECAWIYFDENTTANARQAAITLQFYLLEEKEGTEGDLVETETKTVEYTVKQRGLVSVTAGGKTYQYESYEEYLHSYDAADTYNLSTSPVDYTQQGLSWGLNGKNLSKHIIVSALPLAAGEKISIDVRPYVSDRYDYFHTSDIPTGSYYTYTDKSGDWKSTSFGTGLDFTDRASANELIKVKDMGTLPENAYQYCLSKNKFTVEEKGVSMDIHWYLPDAYELQTVLSQVSTNNAVSDFTHGATYWSSQPGYNASVLNTSYDWVNALINALADPVKIIRETTTEARGVLNSETKSIQQIPRGEHHRIRCMYSAKAIELDVTAMEGRIPEGIGGNITFDMKAWADWPTQKQGYFSWLPTDRDDYSTVQVPYQLSETYPYPRTANDAVDQVFKGTITYTENYGFNIDPSNDQNWSVVGVGTTGIYKSHKTLGRWPGLTIQNIVFHEASGIIPEYYEPDGDKRETKVEQVAQATVYDGDITAESLRYLDHTAKGSLYTISFGNGKNTTSKPTYLYKRDKSSFIRKTTRTWQVPSYKENKKTETVTHTQYGDQGKQVILTAEEEAEKAGRRYSQYQTEPDGYIYPTEQDAIAAGNKVSLPSGAKEKNVTAEPKSRVVIYRYGNTKYSPGIYPVYATRWRYKITYKLDGQTVYYYAYQQGGNWNYSEPVPSNQQTFDQTVPPTTDELRIYSGNTFTISVPDNYEITKVKVYYSGDNKVWELGGFIGIGKDKLYARFVETSIQVPGSQSSPIQLDGMEYQDNFSSGITTSGWQQWTGKGKQSVTFKLMDYYDEAVGASARRYSYRDVVTTGERPSNLDKYLVVDKIEVKVVQKTSTQTE